MSNPVTVSWELQSPASIQRTWEAFSDTDRFNKLAEQGFSFEEHPQPDGSVKRTGHARFLGMNLSWDELPFAWSKPDWFRVERHFHGSPAEKVVITLRLKANKGGTSVRYSVAVHPRSALLRPLAQVELATNTKPKLDRALKFLIRELSAEQLRDAVPLLGGPPKLSEEADALLRQRADGIEDAGVREGLVQLIRSGSLRDQDRILPLVQARAWARPPTEVVTGMLAGVRSGLLTLRWELICPACKGPATHLDSLGQPNRRVHCSSCNVHFDGTFPDSVAVSFRTSPAIRDFEVPIECVGSPGRQPQVIAQQLVLPGEQVELPVAVEPGPHRLRSWPPRDTAIIEISADGDRSPLAVSVSDEGFAPARTQRAAGSLQLSLRNDSDKALQIAVERSERSRDLMTAGQLFLVPGARELLPEQAVDPALTVEAQRGLVVLIRHGEADLPLAERDLSAHAPRVRVCGERGSMGVFVSAAEAVAAATALARAGWPVTLTTGPYLEVQLIDQVVPMGAAVDDALAWMHLALPRLVLIPQDHLDNPELAAATERAGLTADPARRPMLTRDSLGVLVA